MASSALYPQLGLKPLSIADPYKADSEFDSTVRIPIRPARFAARAPSLGAAPIGTPTTTPIDPRTQPSIPSSQPALGQTPTGTPPTANPSYLGPTLPQTYDPTQLNFEGTSGQQFLGGIPTTNTVTSVPSDTAVQNVSTMLQQLQDFTGGDRGLRLPADWRTQLQRDPAGFLAAAKNLVEQGKQGQFADNRLHADTAMRQRLDDWYSSLEKAVGATTTQQPNPDYKVGYLGQAAFENAIQQLKLADASTSRGDEEQLMALLQSRGLLGSGAAAQALSDFREQRMSNFYNAASAFSQALLSGQISQVNARDLATLQADLQKRNAESLAAIQNKYSLQQIQAGKPNPLAQLFGTAVGVGASALLSPKAPGAGGADTTKVAAPYDPQAGYRS